MAAHDYAFTLTPGNSSRPRSLAIAGAAIAAVCVLSSTVVMRELVGAPAPRAVAATASAPVPVVVTAPVAAAATTPTPTMPTVTTPAVTADRTWTLEPRWWPSAIKQALRPAPTMPAMPDSELTFAKGYQLRLAARQTAQPAAQPASPPAQIAAGPNAETQQARTATPVRKPSTVSQTDTPPVRRVNAPQVDPAADPFARFDVGTRALAYDAQRPSERGFVYRSAPPPSRGLFGTLY